MSFPPAEIDVEVRGRKICSYRQFDAALNMIRKLHSRVADRRGTVGFLIGDRGVGKTTVLEAYIIVYNREHPPQLGSKSIIKIEFVEQTSVKSLYKSIIDELGGRYSRNATQHDLQLMAERLLINLKTSLIFIDEAQNLLTEKPSQHRAIFDAIKSFTNKIDIAVVLSGLPECIATFNNLPKKRRDVGHRVRHCCHLTAFGFEGLQDFHAYTTSLLSGYDMDPEFLLVSESKWFLLALFYASQGNQYELDSLIQEALSSKYFRDEKLTLDCFRAGFQYYLDSMFDLNPDYKLFARDDKPFDMPLEALKAALEQRERLSRKRGK
ncbi:MAG: TniB family NTP-binding protein [Oceanospirillaceae bacterium]|nr:TniB family NTP-binding protein [Oceanospirillaceae bacterium]